MKIRIAIAGYGNLGRGVECAVRQNPDMELYGIFSRRNPDSVNTLTGASVYNISDILNHKENIDVLIICGGSATDLPVQTPELAKNFNVIDSFDTHANIPQHFDNVDKTAKESGKVAMISIGWDPGMFSLNRLYADAVLPDGKDYTFWGKGVSQGHSDAIRRIDGVKDARQYTIPVDAALEEVRSGSNPEHTTVHFISEDELKRDHSGIPHGGFVIRTGKTGLNGEHNHVIEYSLKLDSNPEFTSSVLVAYARAAYRMNKDGMSGCKTAFDVAPAYLSPKSPEELRKHLL